MLNFINYNFIPWKQIKYNSLIFDSIFYKKKYFLQTLISLDNIIIIYNWMLKLNLLIPGFNPFRI